MESTLRRAWAEISLDNLNLQLQPHKAAHRPQGQVPRRREGRRLRTRLGSRWPRNSSRSAPTTSRSAASTRRWSCASTASPCPSSSSATRRSSRWTGSSASTSRKPSHARRRPRSTAPPLNDAAAPSRSTSRWIPACRAWDTSAKAAISSTASTESCTPAVCRGLTPRASSRTSPWQTKMTRKASPTPITNSSSSTASSRKLRRSSIAHFPSGIAPTPGATATSPEKHLDMVRPAFCCIRLR